MRCEDEVEGMLEGNQVIRLKEPLPYNEGPVKIIVTQHRDAVALQEQNRAALDALNQLLREPDDLTPARWEELEQIIEEHPLRIREGTPTSTA